MVYLTVSTGIGGGAVVDGRLLHGRRGMASHAGHFRIAQDGPRCSCGAIGCFEALASGTALGRRAQEMARSHPSSHLGNVGTSQILEAKHVVEGARIGDAVCRDLITEEAAFLGQGITGLIHLFSPERVIMGGGVAQAFDLLDDGIHAVIRSDAIEPFREVRVVPAALGDNAGLVGAAALAEDLVSSGKD